MSPVLKNVLAVIAGAFGGFLVNMGLIMISGSIIPPPVGVDPTDMESLNASMHLFEAKHFIFPFLAHALGTLAGALITVKLAASHHLKLALLIGVLFLIGGIAAVSMLSAPLWFNVLDLVVAYIPMGWLGWKLGSSRQPVHGAV